MEYWCTVAELHVLNMCYETTKVSLLLILLSVQGT